jgi:methylglyoxal/glyoxal reductase
MPVSGFGAWQLSEGEEVDGAIRAALIAGYRLIDTARIYGNEVGVGRAIRASDVPPGEIFLTTKLWNDDQGYESALRAFDASLERLGVDFVQLYLVHWPNPDASVRKETWRAMEEIYESGRAKAIGVSNYTIAQLEEMTSYATVPPAVNQIEFHPFVYDEAQVQYHKDHDIVLEAYSPLTRAERLTDPRISDVAMKYGKTNAQVLIRWSLQHGCVPIPKSSHKERIVQNIDVFNFEIFDEDMAALDDLRNS